MIGSLHNIALPHAAYFCRHFHLALPSANMAQDGVRQHDIERLVFKAGEVASIPDQNGDSLFRLLVEYIENRNPTAVRDLSAPEVYGSTDVED